MCSKEEHIKLIKRKKQWHPLFVLSRVWIKGVDSYVGCNKCDDVLYFNSKTIGKEEKKK